MRVKADIFTSIACHRVCTLYRTVRRLQCCDTIKTTHFLVTGDVNL